MSAREKIGMVIGFALCVVASLFNGIEIGFQGNGNLIITGLIIGIILGAVWSWLLVFGLRKYVKRFHLSAKELCIGILLIGVLVLFPMVSYQLWGHAVSFTPP